MAYTNSSLVSYTKLSPNHSGQRTHSIDRITPHCVVGQCSVETLGNIFLPTSRQASSNYGIGVDGRVGMYVEEKTAPGAPPPQPTTRELSPSSAPATIPSLMLSRMWCTTGSWSYAPISASATARQSCSGWAIRPRRSTTPRNPTRWF